MLSILCSQLSLLKSLLKMGPIILFFFVGAVSAANHRKVMIRTQKQMNPSSAMSKAESDMSTMDSMTDQMNDQSKDMGDELIHDGKYFMYTNHAKHNYESGYKRGNHHHHIERSEKADPHMGRFKTKVRWGDKHGGYGEHYWDYNHAGHEKGNSDDMSNMQDDEGDESNPMPQKAAMTMSMSGMDSMGNHDYMSQPKNHRMSRQSSTTKPMAESRVKRHKKWTMPKFVFDTATWTVIDENTGQSYYLQPILT